MKYFLSIILFLSVSFTISAQNFDNHFIDKTLRVDYVFSGDNNSQIVALDQLSQLPKWAGRRHNLPDLLIDGNGHIKMYRLADGKLIYADAFSTLFQEWQVTDEAQSLRKSFENTFLLPYPKEKVEVEVSLRDRKGNYIVAIKHAIDPADILIKKTSLQSIPRYSLIHQGGAVETCINVAILAEGFTASEMDKFREYARITVEQILGHAPFVKLKDKFNFYAVETVSANTGVSVPRQNKWLDTAFGSHFDTFYSDRYLTTTNVKDIHNAIAGVPYGHIIILANTNEYGGGGILNAYTLTTTGHPDFKPVVVHEFGHSFAGLADEYYYETGDVLDQTYSHDIEPWEQNITTLIDFRSKWKDMLMQNTPVPTNITEADKYKIGVFEGAGYSVKGIYRPTPDCRMKTNTSKEFCPVCQRAIERLVKFYTEQKK